MPAPRRRSEGASAVARPRAEKPGSTPNNFPIVALGASAGGVEALSAFLKAMPADSGMAFVVIGHLVPDRASRLAELLGRYSAMPALEAEEGVRVEANHVYVIPPNRYLSIAQRVLHAIEPTPGMRVQAPIDRFFRDLAQDIEDRAMCIVLSGTGTDGTRGLKAVKEGGGLTLVQDPATAQHDGMPRSAIGTGMVDHVVPVADMPAVLLDYARRLHAAPGPEGAAPADPRVSAEMAAVLDLLKVSKGFDFEYYKPATLVRRIHRRMGLRRVEQPGEYLTLLREQPDEVDALFKDLLICVTDFFREPEAWQVLLEEAVRHVVTDTDGSTPLRAWVAGCATGEEAYSVAILAAEEMERQGKRGPIQIFATDVSANAIATARAGVYPETIAADITPARLQRFFVRTEDEHHYRVRGDIRETIVFAQQNLVADPPFSRLDLVTCRNLLIYLKPEIQERLIALFHHALRPGGYLFLGSAEGTGHYEHGFEAVSQKSKKWKIYRRIGRDAPMSLEFPIGRSPRAPGPGEPAPHPVAGEARLARVARQLIAERFSPACVLIDRGHHIVYYSGPTERYLAQPIGTPTQDLLALSREGMRTKLRDAVQQAVSETRPVVTRGARVRRDSRWQPVKLTVIPLTAPQEAEGLLLVTFEDEASTPPGAERDSAVVREPEDERLGQLETELQETREDLRTNLEELETSNEELRAANEEIWSMNEELRSANEELETSKEELQSLNEELSTLNQQLESKLLELEATANDLKNLLNSADLPVIFLSRDFRIKRFTPAVRRMLNLLPADVGRPLNDFAHELLGPAMQRDAERVLQQFTPVECEVTTQEGRRYVRRILPYRTEDDHIEGVVVTLLDVTGARKAEETETRLAAIIRSSVDAIIVKNLDGIITDWNEAAERMYGYAAQEAIGRHIRFLIPEDRQGELEEIMARLRRGQATRALETVRVTRSSERRTVLLNVSPLQNPAGAIVGGAAVTHDITARIRAEELFRAAVAAAPSGLVMIDAAGIIRLANQELGAILGYSRDELVGQPIEVLVPPRFATAHAGHRGLFFRDPQRRPMGGRQNLFAQHRDGREIPVEIGLNPVRTDRGTFVLASVIDITHRLRTEERIAAGEEELRTLNATLEQRVAERTALLRLLHEVAAAANRAGSAAEALDAVIELVCRSRGWTAGHLYWRVSDRGDELAPSGHWYVEPGRDLGRFIRETRERRFAWGEGLVGRVARSGEPVWADPLESEDRFLRRSAVEAGLHTAVLVPVVVDHIVRAVLEFYTTTAVPRDEDVLGALVHVASQIGLVIARHDLEKELSELADEEERRIGGELHDRVGQALSAAGLLARGLQRRLELRAAAEAGDAAAVVEAVEETKENVRSLVRGLVPAEIETGGVVGAVEDLLRRYAATSGMDATVSSEGDVSVPDKFAATQLLRIAQEAVHNAVTHGRGSRILVEFAADDRALTVSIHDDGRGLPETGSGTGGMGLRIMRHRATLIGGTLEVGRGKLGGTTITCTLPRS